MRRRSSSIRKRRISRERGIIGEKSQCRLRVSRMLRKIGLEKRLGMEMLELCRYYKRKRSY